MATDCGAGANLLVGYGRLAGFDALHEVGNVVFADVKFYGGVGEIEGFGFLDLGGAGGGDVGGRLAVFGRVGVVIGDGFAANDEHEFAAVDAHFAVRAVENDAESVFVLDGDAVGIDEFGAAFGGWVGGRDDLHRAAVVHAQAPLRDVEVMRAPVATEPLPYSR